MAMLHFRASCSCIGLGHWVTAMVEPGCDEAVVACWREHGPFIVEWKSLAQTTLGELSCMFSFRGTKSSCKRLGRQVPGGTFCLVAKAARLVRDLTASDPGVQALECGAASCGSLGAQPWGAWEPGPGEYQKHCLVQSLQAAGGGRF